MKKIIIAALAALFALASCQEATPDYAKMKRPVIELMYQSINPDLNRVDNTPVVCVVFSEAGLGSVKLFVTEGGRETLVKEITEFKNEHQYSLKETPSWSLEVSQLRIEATDKGGRKAEAVIPVTVTPVLPAPVITFEKEIIRIDEFKEDSPTVTTRFTVTSSNTLADVKAALFTSDGIVDVPLSPTFHPGDASYSFEQDLDYLEGYRGLQVSATDANGKMKIETLPVDYIPAPAPELVPGEGVSTDALLVRSTESKTFTFQVTAASGLSSMEAVAFVKDAQGKETRERVDIQYFDATSTTETEYSYTFEGFNPAAYAIAFVAVDRLNHEVTYRIPTLVDMRYGTDLVVSAQRNTVVPLELPDYPGGQFHCFFSVRDFKTYSLLYWWEVANRRNIDFFYFAWNAGATRLMRPNENRDGQDPEGFFRYNDGTVNIPQLGAWPTSGEGGRNATVIHKLTSSFTFNFDNVTVADFASAAVTAKMNDQGKTSEDWLDFKAGDSFLFKTGPLSTYPNCIGIFRFDKIVGDRDSFTGNNAVPNDKPAYAVISIKTQIIE